MKNYNQWYLNNRDYILEQSKIYYSNNKDYKNLLTRNLQRRIKNSLFELLGGKKCSICGFSDERALQFDHIDGNGSKEYREFKANYTMYRFYLKNPELAKQKLQVLCANCNWIKRHTNGECKNGGYNSI